ncbi:hypothetical protein CSV86_011530 [Pseudomonas putida CSV86]|uniref:Uncharacterized protein n=1 Tax=Pseudomonas bharatica CSV86 TaxID=1005395 RepID=A0A7K4EDU0_9PSED|nr:hypothetical protein [Pseudomonas bharatica]NNJ15818.1 hypothetical protein [Pseudomonas bharatica CSV86]
MLTILKQDYQDVTPIFPAMMREFSKKSYEHQNASFRVLALFPRRPKITNHDHSGIYVTISQELHDFEAFMRGVGVITIAGCPMVRTIWGLSACPKISWLDIAHGSLGEYLNRVDCDDVSGALLSEQDILIRLSRAPFFSLDRLGETVRIYREINKSAFIYGPKYKPVFFLIR